MFTWILKRSHLRLTSVWFLLRADLLCHAAKPSVPLRTEDFTLLQHVQLFIVHSPPAQPPPSLPPPVPPPPVLPPSLPHPTPPPPTLPPLPPTSPPPLLPVPRTYAAPPSHSPPSIRLRSTPDLSHARGAVCTSDLECSVQRSVPSQILFASNALKSGDFVALVPSTTCSSSSEGPCIGAMKALRQNFMHHADDGIQLEPSLTLIITLQNAGSHHICVASSSTGMLSPTADDQFRFTQGCISAVESSRPFPPPNFGSTSSPSPSDWPPPPPPPIRESPLPPMLHGHPLPSPPSASMAPEIPSQTLMLTTRADGDSPLALVGIVIALISAGVAVSMCLRQRLGNGQHAVSLPGGQWIVRKWRHHQQHVISSNTQSVAPRWSLWLASMQRRSCMLRVRSRDQQPAGRRMTDLDSHSSTGGRKSAPPRVNVGTEHSVVPTIAASRAQQQACCCLSPLPPCLPLPPSPCSVACILDQTTGRTGPTR